MTNLISLINQFQQKYTYRQRFIFFAVIFFLAVPAPAYWVITTQNALLVQLEQEQAVLKQHMLFTRLIHHIIQYQIEASYLNEKELSTLHDDISSAMLDLDKIEHVDKNLNFQPISSAFSAPNNVFPLVRRIQSNLNDYFALLVENRENKKDITNIYYKIMEDLRSYAIDSGLMVDNNLYFPKLLESTLFFLPDEQFRLGMLSTGIPLESTPFLHSPIYGIQYDKIYRYYPTEKELIAASEAAYRTYLFGMNDYFNTPTETKQDLLYSIRPLLELNNTWLISNQKLIQHILEKRYQDLQRYRIYFIMLLAFGGACIIGAVLLRLLTRHILDLLDHIKALAKGDFSPRYYPLSSDEFALVGNTINTMAKTLADMSSRVHSLGTALTTSTEHLTYEVKTHETTVFDQETSIRKTEQVAFNIAGECRTYGNIINELSSYALQHPLTRNTQRSVVELQKGMSELMDFSNITLNNLKDIQSQLKHASESTEELLKISDDTHLLSINSSIEENSASTHYQHSRKITLAIQHFSERTAHATIKIRSILNETSLSMEAAEENVNECLIEMENGTALLERVKEQLSKITQHASLQIEKFEELNNAMQEQAFEADSIIESITHVRKNAQETTSIFQQLNVKVRELGNSANELKDLLEVFFNESGNRS